MAGEIPVAAAAEASKYNKKHGLAFPGAGATVRETDKCTRLLRVRDPVRGENYAFANTSGQVSDLGTARRPPTATTRPSRHRAADLGVLCFSHGPASDPENVRRKWIFLPNFPFTVPQRYRQVHIGRNFLLSIASIDRVIYRLFDENNRRHSNAQSIRGKRKEIYPY